MKKVVHIINGLDAGGAETVLLRLVQQTIGRYPGMAVISLTKGGSLKQAFVEAGAEVHHIPLTQNPLGAFLKLTRTLRTLAPDVVQTWMYHADLIGGLAARLAGCSQVIWGIRTTHLPVDAPRSTRVIRRICALLSRWVPRSIVCVARASKEVHAALGYDAARMVVIPNGCGVENSLMTQEGVQAFRASLGLCPEALVIGCVGRYNSDKDYPNLIRAAAQISPKFPSMKVLMVGRGLEPSNGQLLDLIRAGGLEGKCILLGERRDVPRCLGSMDIFCLPSRNEGFPNVLAEAMAMGRACVSTDAGDAVLLLGDTGRIVPIGDSTALARALETLATMTAEERAALGWQAQERVRLEFSLERMAHRMEELYEHQKEGF